MLKLSRYRRMMFREALPGNTIAEYALPVALVVVAGGAIAAFVDLGDLIPNYVAEATGSSVSGSTITGKVMGEGVGGAMGNGGDGTAGTQAAIIGGGGGGIFISGGGYGGSPETVGNDGNDRLLSINLPAPAVRLPEGNPEMTVDSYPAAVRQSVATNRQIEATTDPAALDRLAVQKAADSARVHVASWQDPDGYERYGGEAERDIDDVARGETVEEAQAGDNTVQEQTTEECTTVDGNCSSDSSTPSAGGFLSGLMEAIFNIMRNPRDTAAATNPEVTDAWATAKIEELKALVEGMPDPTATETP